MKKSQYYPFLDGLRAFSILWVIFHHMPIPLPGYLESFRVRGDLGVEIFFMISGFVVIQSLFSSTSIKNFYLKRIFRIIPPYFLTLTTLTLIALFIDPTLRQKLHSIKNIWLSFPLFYYNYAAHSTLGSVPGSLNIFWSLCFEEQFYLILGLTYLLFTNYFSRALLSIVLCTLFLRYYATLANPFFDLQTLQFQSHLRLDAILIGTLCYIHMPLLENILKKISLLILVILFIFLSYSHFQNGPFVQSLIYTFIPITIAAIVLKLKNENSFLKGILEHRFLLLIGVCSYEIYLTHEIILGVLVRLGISSYPFLFFIFAFILSFAGGALFHQIISRPLNIFLRKKFIQT